MRFRRRRKPRVHWVDTHVDTVPLYLAQYQISQSTYPVNSPLTATKLLVKREPQATESISSVLEGKDEGFRMRRIVGQLRFETGQVQQNESFDAYTLTIFCGMAVMKMREDGTPFLGDGVNFVMTPWDATDNSESWIFRRTYSWRLSTWADLDGLGIRDNTGHQPFGDFVDVRVNRRVAPDEDIVLLMGYESDFDLTGISRTYPRFQRNLRMLISR